MPGREGIVVSSGEDRDSTRSPGGMPLEDEDVQRLLDKAAGDDKQGFKDELTRLVHRNAVLIDISRQLSEPLSLDALLERVTQVLMEVLDAERCTIFLHDRDTNELRTRAMVDEKMTDVRLPADRGIAGSVLRSGVIDVTLDAHADPRFNPELDRLTGFHTRNMLSVPVRYTRGSMGQVIGVAQVLNKRGGGFTVGDQRLAEAIAAQAATSIMTGQLVDEIERARTQERQMLEVTAAISSELQLQPLIRKIMETVATIMVADRATLFLHDPRTDELWTFATGAGSEAMAQIRFPSSMGIAGSCFTTGETINIPDAYSDPRFNQDVDRKTGYTTKTILSMPVVNRNGDRIGVVQVLNKEGGPFTEVDETRMRAFSAQASIAIENAKLFDEVVQVKNYNESVLESMSNAVITVDAEGVIAKVNTAALRLLKLQDRADEVVGRDFREFFGEENSWVTDSLEHVRRTGDPEVAMDAELHLDHFWPQHDPERRRTEASINLTVLPLADAREEQIGSMLMIEDITGEKRLKSTMARYMSKEVADKLLREGEEALGGQVQKASVVFTDIRSFTSISERIGPQETVSLLNDYFGIMVDIILEHGGILDKYIGDAIMAVFGVPFASEQDADNALKSAIEMVTALRRFNDKRAELGHELVRMGIGMNSGHVVSGNIGSPRRMDYTVIGDGVNLASRLEGANKLYGTQLLVSEFTKRELRGVYKLREVDRIRVKGKSQPVGVFQVLDHVTDKEFPEVDRVLDLFNGGLGRYRDRDFAGARTVFEEILQIHPEDPVSRLYVDRCCYFAENSPPDDWDGVWEMKSK